MAKPNWEKLLSEVLHQKTRIVELVSERTGNTYTAEVVPLLTVYSVGSVEEVAGGYRYAIADTANGLEYAIKAPNKVNLSFGTALQFKNVRGGATNNGGWYAAEAVAVVEK